MFFRQLNNFFFPKKTNNNIRYNMKSHVLQSIYICFVISIIAVILNNLNIILTDKLEDLSIIKFPCRLSVLINFFFILSKRIIFSQINNKQLKYALLFTIWLFAGLLVAQGVNVSIFKDMDTLASLIAILKSLNIEDLLFLLILFPIPINIGYLIRLLYLSWSLFLSLLVSIRPINLLGFRGINPLTTSKIQSNLDEKASDLETKYNEAKNILEEKEQEHRNLIWVVTGYEELVDVFTRQVEYARNLQEDLEDDCAHPDVLDEARENTREKQDRLNEWEEKLDIYKEKLAYADNELKSAKAEASDAKAKAEASGAEAKDYRDKV